MSWETLRGEKLHLPKSPGVADVLPDDISVPVVDIRLNLVELGDERVFDPVD